MGFIFDVWRRCLASVRRRMEIVFGRRFLSTLAVASASVTRLAQFRNVFLATFFARGCKRVGFLAVARRKHVMCYSVSALFVFYCHRQEAEGAGQRSAAAGQPRRSPQGAHREAPGGPRRPQGDQGRPRGRGLVGTRFQRVPTSPCPGAPRLGGMSKVWNCRRIWAPGRQKCEAVVKSALRGVTSVEPSSNLGSGPSEARGCRQICVPGRQKCGTVGKSGFRGVRSGKLSSNLRSGASRMRNCVKPQEQICR